MSDVIVTIDGPAASGKSSLSRELAKRLGWPWVSTGAFYRGLAFIASETKADLENEQALVDLSVSDIWEVQMAEDFTRVVFKGEDVTNRIFVEEVGSIASKISHYPRVREALLEAQRRCAKGTSLVAEGRDCGTVVFPKAEVKFYVTASSESRAKRRAQEGGGDVESIQQAQKQRDAQDTGRAAAPLQVADNAHVIDTSELTLNESVDLVESIVLKDLGL